MTNDTEGPESRENSAAVLRRFLATSATARRASAALKGAAEIGIRFTDVQDEFRFMVTDGEPCFVSGRPTDPDFELTLAPGAVRAIAGHPDGDIGDLGVAFFQHILSRESENRIGVKLHSGIMKLTIRGYLAVLAQGGVKVTSWLSRKGLEGPGAIVSAITRLRAR